MKKINRIARIAVGMALLAATLSGCVTGNGEQEVTKQSLGPKSTAPIEGKDSAVLISAQEPVYSVLNPRGQNREIEVFPLATRPKRLSNKVVYVISQHVGDADIFLKKVAKTLPEYLPGVKAVYRDKANVYAADEPELWNEIALKGVAFIYGCAA
jgi:hypothetical protein